MEDFLPFISAILPILLFILFGIGLKKIDFLPSSGWGAIEKLIYYILFPALLIHSISTLESDIGKFLAIIPVLNIAVLIMFLLSFIAWKEPNMNGPRFTSIMQNNIRFNGYVPITLLSYYSHDFLLPIVALGMGMLIPTVNVLSVWSLIVWGKASQNKSSLKSIFINPLVLACAVGFALKYFKIDVGNFIKEPLNMLGDAAMPLGLMAVGAAIDFEQMKQFLSKSIFWATFRAIMLPLCVLISGYLLGIKNENIMLGALLIATSPTATNSYILSRQMGGDATFMASLIGTSTIIGTFTMPFIIFLFFNF